MPSPADDSKWEYRPHMEPKHRLLEYYLPLWCKILGKKKRNMVYWDCFAGRGDYSRGEPGSPLIATEISTKCKNGEVRKDKSLNLHCIFIEKKEENYLYLKDLLSDLYPPEMLDLLHIYHGEFTEIYRKLVNGDEELFRKQYPNFFFLDPYGVSGIPLKIIRQIMARPRHEVLINLMAETIKRHRNHPDMEPHLKSLFGVDDLSEVQEIGNEHQSERAIAEYYVARLKAPDGGAVKFVEYPFSITPNERNVVKYLLIFATGHPLGLKVMHDAMNAVSNNEDFSYEGRKNGQQSLETYFGVDVLELVEWIKDNIAWKLTTYEDLRTRCCEEHPCSRSVFRRAMLKLEEEGHIIVKPYEGNTRRGDSFSDHPILFPSNFEDDN